MTTYEVCPKCGAALYNTIHPILAPDGKPDLQFCCNSILYSHSGFKQSQDCKITTLTRDLAAANAKLAKIEADKDTILGLAVEASGLTGTLSIEAAQILRLLYCYQRVEDTQRLYDAICKSEEVNAKLQIIFHPEQEQPKP